jgi:hypothetical protein
MDRQQDDGTSHALPESVRRLIDAGLMPVILGHVERSKANQAATFEAFARARQSRADAAQVLLGTIAGLAGELLADVPREKRAGQLATITELALIQCERFEAARRAAH